MPERERVPGARVGENQLECGRTFGIIEASEIEDVERFAKSAGGVLVPGRPRTDARTGSAYRSLRDEGGASVEIELHPAERDADQARARVIEAVQRCPKQAIKVVDE